jgi:hypothetical protein
VTPRAVGSSASRNARPVPLTPEYAAPEDAAPRDRYSGIAGGLPAPTTSAAAVTMPPTAVTRAGFGAGLGRIRAWRTITSEALDTYYRCLEWFAMMCRRNPGSSGPGVAVILDRNRGFATAG